MVLPVAPARARQLPKHRMWSSFELAFSIDQDGHVKVPLTWQAENLVTIKLPVPTRITTSIRVHKRAAPVFEFWFRMWNAEACGELKEFGGSYNPRLMRMAKNLPVTDSPTRDWAPFLSRHSRAIAIDFNHSFELNKQGRAGVTAGQPGTLHKVLELARQVRVPVVDPSGKTWEAGLVCGVDWSPKYRDPMHVEVGCW